MYQKDNLISRLRSITSIQSIYSIKNFHKILEIERLRSDRTGHKFSILIFDTGDEGKDLSFVVQLQNSHAIPL